MKIVIISNSDANGGAGLSAFALMNALRDLGQDARMLVMRKVNDSPYVQQLQPAWKCKACFLGSCADIYLHNEFNRADLFKVSSGSIGMPVSEHPWVNAADAVLLGWINQGMMSLREIAKIKCTKLWTMHDMWTFTGGCHVAHECQGYLYQCGNCPLLHHGKPYSPDGPHQHDMSRRIWNNKNRLYENTHILFVGVSSWLVKQGRESTLLRNQDITLIHNPHPVHLFHYVPKCNRKELGLPEDKKLIIFGAARLDDPLKGLDRTIEAMNRLQRNDVAGVFFGDVRNPNAFDGLKIPYVHLGSITDRDRVREIYSHGHAVISASSFECLPGTLIEGMAAGCVPVSFDYGGQGDIIEHKVNGYLAHWPDINDLSEGLRWALDAPMSREELHAEALRRFAAPALAKQYLQAIEDYKKKYS